MPTTKHVSVKELKVDLKNFRTVPQRNEIEAVHAMISIDPKHFWGLAASLLDSGYLPTENIIVLKTGMDLTVKEGNRRIGALKLIFGYINRHGFSVPGEIEIKIKSAATLWKTANQAVPCTIYGASEESTVDKIVTLAHGKGEEAGRVPWESVARARHNREKNGGSEPALDLLEKYLKDGKNLTIDQGAEWSGTYPLSVLENAMKTIAPRLGFSAARELAEAYPKGQYRKELEAMMRDIGLGSLGFLQIRNKAVDFANSTYGLPLPVSSSGAPAGTTPYVLNVHGASPSTGKVRAVSVSDPRAVRRRLKKFFPTGNNREKVVTLLEEARTLNLEKHALSFCFVLRSMFEISAKLYCDDHAAAGLSTKKASGEDKLLVDVLREITNHMTGGKSRTNPMTKLLHGAMAELGRTDGFLSVTSMNQLVHNTRFVVDATHISLLFNNIFPLLEAMNR